MTGVSADFMRSQYRGVATVVIGRRLFDETNGWNGKPTAGGTSRPRRSERASARGRCGRA
jgi:hypothetical protein